MSYITPRIRELAEQANPHGFQEDPEVDIKSSWYIPSSTELALHASEWAQAKGHDQESAAKFAGFYVELNEGQPWESCMPRQRALQVEYRRHLEMEACQSRHPSRRPSLSIV